HRDPTQSAPRPSARAAAQSSASAEMFFGLADVLDAADEEGRSLMQRRRLDVEDAPLSIRSCTARGLRDKGERRRLIKEPEFSVGVPPIAGIGENPPTE